MAAGAVGMRAQTDVTSTYLANPSFETLKASDGTTDVTVATKLTDGLYGWTIDNSSMSDYQVESQASGSVTGFPASGDNRYIVPSEGTYYYFNRKGWGNLSTTLSTTTKTDVEVGTYYLVFDYKAADYSNNNNASKNGTTIGITVEDALNNPLATLSAVKKAYSITNGSNNPGTDAYMNTAPWSKMGVAFTVTSASTLTFKVQQNMVNSGRSDIVYDNFKLYKIDDANSVDFTGYIANPSFEAGNTNGWTILSGSDVGAKLNSNSTYTTNGADGLYVFNIWGGTAPYKVSQTISGLPEGYYQVTALVASDANQNIQVYCGNGKVYDASTDKATGKNITTPVAYVSGGSVEIGATSYSWFKCDNFRLTYLGTDFTPTAEIPLAVTDKASLAWNVSGTTVQWGIQLRETYSGSTTAIVQDDLLTQTISGLDNGNYRVRMWAEASHANNVAGEYPADGTTVAQLYANETTQDVGLATQGAVAGGTLDLYTLNTEVKDHTLKIGMNATAVGANWHIIQIENLLYTGPLDLSSYQTAYNALVSEAGTAKTTYTQVVGKELSDLNAKLDEEFDTTSPDAYETINTELRTLIDAFIAAAPNYDLLATEKTKAAALGMTDEAIADATPNTKTGLLALQDLKVAEYNYVTTTYEYGVELGEWTSTGVNTSAANFSNEHWSGTTHNYKNQNDSNGQGWNANSWSINFSQDVTLPAGNYVFKVAGRQASDEHVTTSLVVKLGEEELGSISDFPRSNSSRGINKSGATSFNEDASAYANEGKGFGWEWRYVKFTLTADATVNIAVNSAATANHCWVSFGDYTLQTDNEANISLISYNVALNNAQTVLADATYTNVAGTDKSSLEAAIDADETLDKSNAEAIDAATTALNTAATTFTSGVASWNAYVLAKGYGEAINSTVLPYATAAKLTAVTTAIAATVNTAAEALAQADAINAANRAAYESNGIAENISGAKNRTSLITNADGSASAGWEGSSNFWTANGEAYTEADGNTTNTYFDKNGVKNFTASQTIKLPKGNYILSVTARAQAGINSYKMQVMNNASETAEVALTAMGNANGVFNRGWNDFTVAFEQKAYGDATISIIGDNTENDANFWMSWDRFRLYCIGEEGAVEIAEDADFTPVDMEDVDVTLNRTIKANVNTLVLPFNMTQSEVEEQFGVGSKVYVVKSYDADRENISFDVADGVTANVPCLLQATQAGTSYDLETRTIVAGALTYAPEDAGVSMTGNYEASLTVPENAYVVSNGKIYVVDSEVTIAGTRAYISLTQSETPAKARVLTMSFEGDDATGIAVIENGNINIEKGTIYNLNGQRVANLTKGIYIVNGKKILVK